MSAQVDIANTYKPYHVCKSHFILEPKILYDILYKTCIWNFVSESNAYFWLSIANYGNEQNVWFINATLQSMVCSAISPSNIHQIQKVMSCNTFFENAQKNDLKLKVPKIVKTEKLTFIFKKSQIPDN